LPQAKSRRIVFALGTNGRSGPVVIELLGGFRVVAGGVAVPDGAWRLRKARGLIKLLALAPEHRLHRERVIDALWPDGDPAAASNSLRQALFAARRALDGAGVRGADRLQLVGDLLSLTDEVRIDVEQFEQAADVAEREPTIANDERAIERYTGELLPEDRFEAWTAARRQALHERHLGLLVELACRHERAGDHAGALAAIGRVLVAEPFHEPAHRIAMRLYALAGRRQRALAQFHTLRESLRREYADEPEVQTRRLYQEILTRRFGAEPAMPSSDPRPLGNLPLQLTTFVGRDRELRDVVGLARRHRLLALTGPGGCGKTRLALEAATALLPEIADGAWLVELAGLGDGTLVAKAVAAALGIESRSGRDSSEAVAATIGARPLLLVLDNCEHLIAAVAGLAEGLLRRCPGLRILATSREPLHVAGEVEWRVPSLAPVEAVRLFAERAGRASSRFALSEENAAAVAEVCRRVDGIPLAIELAAARVGVLAPAQIAERLRDSIAVLAGGSRTELTRQQTLTATLDWSHELLGEAERRLFRRLGVFAGSFDLAAVEAVCDGGLDLVGQLVDKSLIGVEEHHGSARYRLLDTVRHYARERLAEAQERAEIERRHRDHHLGLAEELGPLADTPGARERLGLIQDDVRAALASALDADPELAVRLSAALWTPWHDSGERTEGASWLTAALDAAPSPSAARAEALHGLSVLALRIGDDRTSTERAAEAVAIFRAADDPRALADELHHLATINWVFSEYDAAERHCQESRDVAEPAGVKATVASVIHTLGVIAASRFDGRGRELTARSIELLRALPADGEPLLLPVAAGYGHVPGSGDHVHRLFFEETFVTARRVSPARAIGYALCDLSKLTRDAGEPVLARELIDDALATFARLDDALGRALALRLLGNLLSAQGDHELAADAHEECLEISESAGDARSIGLALIAISVEAAHAGEPDRAWSSAARALALFERCDDRPGCAGSVVQLGHLAADAGRLREALELQERGLELWRGYAMKSGWTAPILLELAELHVALGEPERAPARIRQALAVAEHIGDRGGAAHCQALLGGAPHAVNGPITASP
jgi:predicted ATPase/DNA-binding SARP family transcriptional activator